jgi:Flp pilus assembly protein TadD
MVNKGKGYKLSKWLPEAIRLNPNDYLSYISRGIACRELRQNVKARLDFRKVISLNLDSEILAFVNKLLGEMYFF